MFFTIRNTSDRLGQFQTATRRTSDDDRWAERVDRRETKGLSSSVGSVADRIDSIQRTVEERSDRLSRWVSEWISSTSNPSDFRDHSMSHSREFPSQRTDRTSHRTIGQIRPDQSQGLRRARRSHSNSGHSRRSTSPISEETSHHRTPSSPNLIESSWIDANAGECRRTTKSTERNSVGQRREEDSSKRLVHVSVERSEWSSQRHYRSSSDLRRSFYSGIFLITDT